MSIQTLQSRTTIEPGQRYRSADFGLPLATSELVIDRLVHDELGMLHVVLRDLESREISLFVEQFETAIESGFLTSVDVDAFAYT